MINKRNILLSTILAIAVVGVVVYFITRPQQHELLPQTFAPLPEKPKLIDEFHQNTEIYSVAFSPVDPSLIAFVDENGTIKMWNRNITNKPAVTLNHPDKYPSIGFSPTGKLLVCAAWNLILWDVDSGEKINTLKTSYGGFTFTPDGHFLATNNNVVKLWDIRNPKHITEAATFPFDEAHKAKGRACAVGISSDGKLIAAGYARGTINVWDLNTKQLVRTLKTSYYEMNFLKFSPNNKFLAAGGPVLFKDNNDKTWVSSGAKGYSMWELPNWKLHGSVQRGNIENLVFSPDEKICVGTNDWLFYGRGVEIWSTEDGAPITSLQTAAKDVSFSNDGNLLATGGRDGKVRVWKLNHKHLDLTTTPADVVRIIYCLPKDEEPPPDITTKLDESIRKVQDFYANELEKHGFGRKTFSFETDENGKLKVYLLRENDRIDYDLSNEIWIVILDKNTTFPKPNYKLPHFGRNKTFWYTSIGNNNLQDNVHAEALAGTNHGSLHYVYTKKRKIDSRDIAHELKLAFAAFDWKYPNFNRGPNKSKSLFARFNRLMPWGKGLVNLSKCEAEWLDRSRFFNPNQPFFDNRPEIDMNVSKADDSDSRLLRFTVADEDDIHQVQMFSPVDPKYHSMLNKFEGCHAINGKKTASVEYLLSNSEVKSLELRMIDMHGNIASRKFTIRDKTVEPEKQP
ncbi:MAG: hypothetical protein OXD54_15650 [Candidatus Poribacteria bacterium]|nr:hypothetical protein [Candidatus Poribacteria bacterium]